MSKVSRLAALVVAGLFGAGGLALHDFRGGGWGLIALGLAIAVAAWLDPRYRARQPLGPVAWQRTAEREVDVETGAILAVWYDPQTGARKLEPVD